MVARTLLFLAFVATAVATASASAGTPVKQTADDFVSKPLAAADDTWTCTVCGHVYDAAADGGGVAFTDLPDSWVCPICGAAKSAYVKSVDADGKATWVHQHAAEQKLAAADDTWTCTVCGHVYDAAADGGGVAFADLPDSWVCPICGAAKSAYVKSMLNGKVVWTHNEDHPEEKVVVKQE
jgi:rubredoxin